MKIRCVSRRRWFEECVMILTGACHTSKLWRHRNHFDLCSFRYALWILQHIATYCNILQHIATSADTFANVLAVVQLLVLQGISRRASCTSDILGEHWRNVGTSSVNQPLLVDHDMGLWLSTWIVIIPWSWSLCYTIQYNQYKYWGLSLSITTHGNPMKSSQYFHAFADVEDPLPGSDCSQRHVLEIEQRSQKRGGCTWWDEADEVGTNMNEPQASTSINQHQSTSININHQSTSIKWQ